MNMSLISRRMGIFFWILIILPKLNLLSFAGESAGIRIDDLLIAASIPLLYHLVAKGYVALPRTGILLVFFGWCIGCTLINNFVFGRGSILYPIRFMEYATFLIAGSAAWNGGINLARPLAVLVGLNTVVILLQYAGIIGGFSSEGYVASVANRPIGLTGGPWEVSVLIDFAFAWYLCYERRTLPRLIGFAIAAGLVLITGARMPLLALLVITMAVMILDARRNPLQTPTVIMIGLAIAAVLTFVDNPLTSRSAGLFSSNNVDSFANALAFRGKDTDFDGFAEFSEVEDGDASWLMRVIKWSTAISIFLSDDSSFLIGLGHGIWGPALDGGFLRLITEGGFLALILFYLAWIRMINTRVMWLCLVVFTINMFMIDVYLSYKIMGMLYFMTGYFWNLGLRDRAPRSGEHA